MSNIKNKQIISKSGSRQSKEIIILLILMGQLQLQVVSDYYCPEVTCKGVVIRFPFRVLYQSFQSCGYPGFELTSYSTKQPPLIQFPLKNNKSSIRFEVSSISYIDQQIELSLPKPGRRRSQSQSQNQSRCLAKELISLNTSATPFNYDYYSSKKKKKKKKQQKNNNNIILIFFTLYNCSRHDANHRFPELDRIECMSGLSYTVVCRQDEDEDEDEDEGGVVGGNSTSTYNHNSNSTTSFNIQQYCDKIAQLKLLTTATTTGIDHDNNKKKNLSDIRSFFLGWNEPAECRKCELEGKRCRFKSHNNYDYNWGSRSLPQLECYDPDKDDDDASPRKTTRMAVIVGVAFGLGIPALILVTLVFYAYIKPPLQQQQQQATNTNAAAAAAAAASWCPVVVLGESGRILANSEDKSCAICLSDYQPKDTLRLIPNCSHTFHAHCIDHWLLTSASNPTCPLCRIQFPIFRHDPSSPPIN